MDKHRDERIDEIEDVSEALEEFIFYLLDTVLPVTGCTETRKARLLQRAEKLIKLFDDVE